MCFRSTEGQSADTNQLGDITKTTQTTLSKTRDEEIIYWKA